MQSLQDCYQGLEIQLLERRYGFTASDRKNFSAFCFVACFVACCIETRELEISTFTKKNRNPSLFSFVFLYQIDRKQTSLQRQRRF